MDSQQWHNGLVPPRGGPQQRRPVMLARRLGIGARIKTMGAARDIEPDLLVAESGSLPAARMPPPFREGISRRCCRRTSSHIHMTVQDKDSAADTEDSDSEDDLDVQEVQERIYVEEYCPSLPDAPEDDFEDDFEELHCRKRRRVPQSPHASPRGAPASARSSHQQRSTRRTAQLPRGRRILVRDSESPAPSQTSSVPSGTDIFARFKK
ncbi:hypothetical protein FOVSG1_006480 [Fusarium oxysporum f. sp. vasinfectum]